MEILNQLNWEEFLSSPVSLLILSKTDCQLCDKWFSELESYEIPSGTRLGKLLLDSPGLGRFKMANDWIANIDILPFNAIYVDGIVKKQWSGGGIERLQTRLNQILQP
tara:strand:+ start:1053 stop:1376 length:324 start_codon:yes stop_codon:yes gene_type:complete